MENAKTKKPIFKKWWFWLIVIVVIVAVISSTSGGNDNTSDNTDSTVAVTTSGNTDSTTAVTTTAETEPETTITYNKVDLQEMIDALSANALKAEKTYQDMYVEVEGKIKNFDSDGSYVSIEPVNADEWNFDTAMCYIKDETQEEFLLEKSVGDTITVKGQVTSIGEVIGYSINIDSVN